MDNTSKFADEPTATTTSESKAVYKQEESDDSLLDIELDADLLETVLYYLGDFGTYQKLLLVAMIPPAVFFAWVYFGPMFVTVVPEPYWCYVPELSGLTKAARQKLSVPENKKNWDVCKVYDTDWKVVLETGKPPPADTPTKPCTTGWDFSEDEIPYPNIVTERNWVCDKAVYIPTSQVIFFCGSILGGIVFGFMADYYGRVPALMGVNIIGGIGGIGAIFTKTGWDYFICRFFSGMSFDGCVLVAYILILEYVGPSHRTLVATMPIAIYYGGASVAVPWMAYFIRDWRIFTLTISLPMFIVIIAPWTVPESVRWLVSKGRVDDAVKVFRKIERVNRVKVPNNVMQAFIDTSKLETKPIAKKTFKGRLLYRTALFMILTYSILACAYDVIVRMSASLGLNFFVTFTITAAAEIPSVLLITVLLDRLGRRNMTWGPAVLSAVCTLFAAIVPKGLFRVIFACVARFCINLSFNVTVQWAAEILPTPLRATGSAALHISGFASSCLSPFIVYSERVKETLPLIIIFVMVLVAAAFSLVLPETKGLEMPQTIDDTETIILKYSLFRSRETKELKEAVSNLFKTTFEEPIHRNKEGRVSQILTGTSRTTHSKLSSLNLQMNK